MKPQKKTCTVSPFAQMWQRRAESRRCGRKEPSSGADMAGMSQVAVQMWPGWASRGADVAGAKPSPGADVAGVSPVAVQMWLGWAQSLCRCGRGEPSPGADVAAVSPVPVQMWHTISVSAKLMSSSGGGRSVRTPRQQSAVACALRRAHRIPTPRLNRSFEG